MTNNSQFKSRYIPGAYLKIITHTGKRKSVCSDCVEIYFEPKKKADNNYIVFLFKHQYSNSHTDKIKIIKSSEAKIFTEKFLDLLSDELTSNIKIKLVNFKDKIIKYTDTVTVKKEFKC